MIRVELVQRYSYEPSSHNNLKFSIEIIIHRTLHTIKRCIMYYKHICNRIMHPIRPKTTTSVEMIPMQHNMDAQQVMVPLSQLQPQTSNEIVLWMHGKTPSIPQQNFKGKSQNWKILK